MPDTLPRPLPLNPRHIPGIYNYCDRWCERCIATDRCRLHADEAALKATTMPGGHEDPWQIVTAGLDDALAKVAATRWAHVFADIDPPSEAELQQSMRDEDRRDERMRVHPVVHAAEVYRQLVEQWIETETGLFQREGDEAAKRAEAGTPREEVEWEVEQLREAVEVIRHFMYPIHAKLRRAVHPRIPPPELDVEVDSLQNDTNGSAKVALIGIDRSLLAWRQLQRRWPSSATLAVMRDSLESLRQLVEAEFPDARRFLRVGFDTGDLEPPC